MVKPDIKIVILLVSLFTSLLTAADVAVEILKQTPRSLTLQVTFPEPVMESSKLDDGSVSVSMPGLAQLYHPGYAHTPYLTYTFSLPGKQLQYKVTTISTGTMIVNKVAGKEIQNKETVTISFQGLFRRTPLHSITFFPVRFSGNSVEYVKTITVDIWSAIESKSEQSVSRNESSILNKVFLNTTSLPTETGLKESSVAAFPYREGRYKLQIKDPGIYQVTYDDLIDARAPVDQFDTRKLRLLNRGREIPVFFKGGQDGSFDPGDYFEFWGEPNRSPLIEKYPDVYNDPFSDINVYWLENSSQNGLRMVEESGALTVANSNQYITPFFFTERIHFEQDREFIRFGHPSANIDSAGYKMDHWFYGSAISAVGSKTYNAYLPWPYVQQDYLSVFAKVMMRGRSDSSRFNPLLSNHQVDVWLNDAKVATSGRWKNHNYHVITNEGADGLAQRKLLNGNNQLRLQMDQPGVVDITYLNWFDIQYYRRYRAYNDVLRFKKQDDLPSGFVFQFEVDGFTKPNIEVYKLGISKLVNARLDYHTAADDAYNSYRVSFQDEIFYPDLEYIALTPDQKKKPLNILDDRPWNVQGAYNSLFNRENKANYLIITQDLFYDNVLRLKDYRQQQDLSVEVVRVQDIYDEYNFGIKSPLAIKDFLQYAFENWHQSAPLLYVLLVGDASFDYKQNLSSSKDDFVPTFLFETEKYGAAASDYLYSLISGTDPIPDLIIGRVPVENNSELNAYIDKIFGYEAPENTGSWQTRSLFISGNDAFTPEHYTGLPAFRAQNQRLISMRVPEGYFNRKLNTVRDTSIAGGDPNFGGTNTLINHFDDGISMINFFGHGGGGIWADVYLMSTEDVDRLSNGFRLPFIQSMTCFTGAFENSKINGLAEKLLLAPERGAIGILAASGVGWLANDFALGWNLTDYLLDGRYTVGEAVLKAKIDYLSNNLYVTESFDTVIPSYRDLKLSMVNHYNLIGDPYISIPVPPMSLTLTVDNKTPAVNDTVTISIQAPFNTGSGRIELADQQRQPVTESFFALNSAQSQVNFQIPEELSNQNLFVTAYAEDNSSTNDARGQVQMTVNKPLIDSVVVTPRQPLIGEQVSFSVYLTPAVAIDQVRIINLRDSQDHIYTLVLQRISDSLWTSQNPFGPYTKAEMLFFDVQVFDTEGSTYLSRRHPLVISDPRPDLQITPYSFKFDGTEQIQLSTELKNQSGQDLMDIEFSIFPDNFTGSEEPLYTEMLDIQANQSINVSYSIGQEFIAIDRSYIAVSDVQESIDESNEENNVASVIFSGNLYNVPQSIGTTLDGIVNDTISFAETGRLFIPVQGLSGSSVVSVQSTKIEFLPGQKSQPGFSYVPFATLPDSSSILLDVRNQAAQFNTSAYIEFEFDTTRVPPDKRDSLRICVYKPKLDRWLAFPSNRYENKIQTQITAGGTFAVFRVEDTVKPVIEITVNGRIAYNDMLIPQNPNLAILLQDANGIDLSAGLQILIDDLPIPAENQLVPDSTGNANAVSVLTTPQLSQGRHELHVSVRDARGNLETRTLELRVETDFFLRVFGNYPNPFGEEFDETYISFEVGAIRPLDKLELRIYTVSGRLVRKIKAAEIGQPDQKLLEPGYHEILWNGHDDDGDPVANGIYFAVLNAELAGQSKEKTLKIAVLK
jgi:hypothetical protein